MDKLEQQKGRLIEQVKNFCVHCKEGRAHVCPIVRLIAQIRQLRGVPIIVNDALHHVLFS